jgi:hypothetical protein
MEEDRPHRLVIKAISRPIFLNYTISTQFSQSVQHKVLEAVKGHVHQTHNTDEWI